MIIGFTYSLAKTASDRDKAKRRMLDPTKIEAHIELRCPECSAPVGFLDDLPAEGTVCTFCGFRLEKQNGILCALPPSRRQVYARFTEEYLKIREAEGRGSDEASYYLALPYKDLTGKNSSQWRMRGRTYQYFEKRLLPKFENQEALDILDLGAGTGWLSYRLALKNHRPVAIDILADPRDGLGAASHYEGTLGYLFPRIIAEFDNLPFGNSQFDLAIFNSSLHYSVDYLKSMREAVRCLKPSGSIIVLDSPIYRRRSHGERMREERHKYFKSHFGFRSDSIPSIEFLDDSQLEDLSGFLGIRWKVYKPWYGWRWHLRPWKARLTGARPPSRFQILVGSWSD